MNEWDDLWEDFCLKMRDVFPGVEPVREDEKWMNLYTVYEMGYSTAIAHIKRELEAESK